MKEIIFSTIFIFIVGAVTGYFIKTWLSHRPKEFDGTIYVNKDELTEKIVYSLELDEYPEKLAFKKVIIFKVDASD